MSVHYEPLKNDDGENAIDTLVLIAALLCRVTRFAAHRAHTKQNAEYRKTGIQTQTMLRPRLMRASDATGHTGGMRLGAVSVTKARGK